MARLLTCIVRRLWRGRIHICVRTFTRSPGNVPFLTLLYSSIKVVTITGLIILGLVLDLGGGPTHDRIGFRYWKDPGAFAQFDGIDGATGRFLGWW